MSTETERVLTDPKLSRRRRAVARRRRVRWAGRVAVALAAVTTAWVVLWSPLLRVRAVEVRGARHTTAADVAEAASLGAEANILLTSTAEVAARAETLPWVRRAVVERKLPGTVSVTVRERRPAVVVVAGGRAYSLDRRGRVLARGRARPGLPVLVSPATSLAVGELVPEGPARGALSAYRSLGRALRRRVTEVWAPSSERIGFRLADGTLVAWGAADRHVAKRSVLRALLRWLRNDGAGPAHIDVSVPESPAVSSSPPAAAPLDLLRARSSPTTAR